MKVLVVYKLCMIKIFEKLSTCGKVTGIINIKPRFDQQKQPPRAAKKQQCFKMNQVSK